MSEYKVSWWRTSFGEKEVQNLVEAIGNEHLSQGPLTAQFEMQFAEAQGVPYAVATTGGSMALLMALMALGIGRENHIKQTSGADLFIQALYPLRRGQLGTGTSTGFI